jgi:ABC-type branched-subunit amino acid transport system ATPase component/branched-subunit amino acid ABC-type transport system permease component
VTTTLAFEVPASVVILGVIIGTVYGLLAVGLVLIYRSNRVINFAHGEIGAFGSAVFSLLAVNHGVPYYLALPVGLATGAGTGMIAEVAVIRRLRKAPRLMSVVATLGVGQLLVVLALVVNGQAQAGRLYPEPPGFPEFDIGALRVTQAYSGMLLAAPLVVGGLALFLRFSRFGLAIRASAANPEAARLASIPAARMSSLSWGIAGAVSALTAILIAPTRGFIAGASFGPELLLRALAGAVVARMFSLPRAMLAGIAIGVIEQALLWNYPRSGLEEVVLFVVIVVALVVQPQVGGRESEKGSWAAVPTWRPLPAAVRAHPLVRRWKLIGGAVALAVAVGLPTVITNSASVTMVAVFAATIIGLSVGIVSGLGGQLTLGQFAIGAVGATVSFQVSSRIGNFPLALLYAGAVGAVCSILLGLPAVRSRGLLLTVTTLSFALVVPSWLLKQGWMLGGGVDPGRPIVFGHALGTGREYYLFALGVLMLALVLAHNVRAGGFGRLLMAVRDNEDNARAFGVPARRVKLQALMLAGFLAGIGGAVYGHALSRISPATFPASMSIDVAVLAVVGGVGVLAGPLLGALLVIAIPEFLPLDSAGLAATKLGLLLLILYVPGGLAQHLQPLRDRLVRKLLGEEAQPAGEHPSPVADDGGTPSSLPSALHLRAAGREAPRRASHSVILAGRSLTKRFGGLVAVDDVTIEVRAGETLGLIGPNGAGKTTLFELIGGFTRPDTGWISYAGEDISQLGPEERAGLGLVRSFQDAALFPTLTVSEVLLVALERRRPTPPLAAMTGRSRHDRAKRAEAEELVTFFGLGAYAATEVQQLSTGTRRVTELACLLALRPDVILLDEPSSGVAQRETEALGALLRGLKVELSATLVVVEHDIPLITDLADRLVVMEAGRVIAAGDPRQVLADERVVDAYLGGSVEAIGRSGTPAAAGIRTMEAS